MITLYRFSLIGLFFFLFITSQSQPKALTPKEEFLYKYYTFRDSNPIWQEDADRVNNLFKKILKKEYNENERNRIIAEALDLMYDNTMDSFEDAVDIKRMAVRRSMSFATVALIADEDRFRSFLEDARNNLEPLNDASSLYEQHLMLDLIYLLKVEASLGKEDWEYKARLKEMKAYIEKYKNEMEKNEFLSDFYSLIK